MIKNCRDIKQKIEKGEPVDFKDFEEFKYIIEYCIYSNLPFKLVKEDHNNYIKVNYYSDDIIISVLNISKISDKEYSATIINYMRSGYIIAHIIDYKEGIINVGTTVDHISRAIPIPIGGHN